MDSISNTEDRSIVGNDDDQPKQDPHKTCISRVTLAQEVSYLLPAAPFARNVQVIIPASKRVYIDEDRPVEPNEDGSAPRGYAGRNRTYKLPPFEASQTIEFKLAAGQWLVGATDEGLVHLSVIVEPLD